MSDEDKDFIIRALAAHASLTSTLRTIKPSEMESFIRNAISDSAAASPAFQDQGQRSDFETRVLALLESIDKRLAVAEEFRRMAS